ncbi:rab GTPase-binding effector protein 1-like isoform X2 [Ischnura elegans]|uniref:rab GTPase-binding effector protein 1-like isoform X2 n=1 Tax=Ischnura elegans TaxID=197161 RepID=UPI001ED878A8|nr:rab GTPase-binding effector protein 1-like isoform X2 [Ischnura elegans]
MENIGSENEGESPQNEVNSDGPESKTDDDLKEKIRKLEAEKKRGQEEFGIQRARLKELFMKKEEELVRESQERARLQELSNRLKHELDEIRSEYLLSKLGLESEIAQEKRKRDEEVASLEKLMQEAVEEASLTQKRFQDEIRRLQKINELGDSHRSSGDQGPRLPLGGAVAALAPGASIITAYTKSIARKVGSLGPGLSSSSSNPPQVTSPSTPSAMSLSAGHSHPNIGESSAVQSSLTSSEENLEEGMRKVKKYAQEDAEVLRSLVIPLEEEIEALKDKLRNAYHILKTYGYEDGKENLVKGTEETPSSKSNDPTFIDMKSEASRVEDNSLKVSLLANGVPGPKVSQADAEHLHKSPSHPESMMGTVPSTSEFSGDEKQLSFQGQSHAIAVCHMCANYEAQLQKMQEEVCELEKRRKVAEKATERYREEHVKETEFRKDMEEKWNEKKEKLKNQVSELKMKVERSEGLVQSLKAEYHKTCDEVRRQLSKLANEREEVDLELKRLQNENDNLVGKHSAHSRELQNETINLPDKVEDLQELLLKFREEVIAAKVGKEAAEETEKTLQQEVLNLYRQIEAEEQKSSHLHEQISIEEQKNAELSCEYQKLSKELAHMRMVESNLQQQLAETSKKLEEILSLKKEIEATNAELRSRVSGLKQELDNSLKVQQDFVNFSQSLQVQLENIRENEKEVRWQHEDDFEDCANCRMQFSSNASKKHCNHCGRVFCSTCLSESVTSGPNHRRYSVCKVCHTLLVREMPLFFSSGVTDQPD